MHLMRVVAPTQVTEKGHIRLRKASNEAIKALMVMLKEMVDSSTHSSVAIHNNISVAAINHLKEEIEADTHPNPGVDITVEQAIAVVDTQVLVAVVVTLAHAAAAVTLAAAAIVVAVVVVVAAAAAVVTDVRIYLSIENKFSKKGGIRDHVRMI
jgi:hypothetical protein